jgi:hypothetical protein
MMLASSPPVLWKGGEEQSAGEKGPWTVGAKRPSRAATRQHQSWHEKVR